MSGYSKQSQQLARELAEKAAKNLAGFGKTVTRDAATGRYTVVRDVLETGTSAIRKKS